MSSTSPTSSSTSTPTSSIRAHGTPSFYTPPAYRPGGLTPSPASASSSSTPFNSPSSLLNRFCQLYASASPRDLLVASVSTALISGVGLFAWDRFFPRNSPLSLIRYFGNSLNSARFDFKEHQLLRHVFARAAENDPDSVLAVIDSFAREKAFLMNVGDKKGEVLKQQIRKKQPKVAVELGGYCGYSAILIASNLPAGSHLYTIEINPLFAAIATKIIEFAGLSSKVTVLVGTAETKISTLINRHKVGTIDLLFIDHAKNLYVSDLKLFEQSGLIKTGSVVVADNILFPGAPEYAAYIRGNPKYDSTFYEGFLEYSNTVRDGVEVSVRL